jgi:hypothetical protein
MCPAAPAASRYASFLKRHLVRWALVLSARSEPSLPRQAPVPSHATRDWLGERHPAPGAGDSIGRKPPYITQVRKSPHRLETPTDRTRQVRSARVGSWDRGRWRFSQTVRAAQCSRSAPLPLYVLQIWPTKSLVDAMAYGFHRIPKPCVAGSIPAGDTRLRTLTITRHRHAAIHLRCQKVGAGQIHSNKPTNLNSKSTFGAELLRRPARGRRRRSAPTRTRCPRSSPPQTARSSGSPAPAPSPRWCP